MGDEPRLRHRLGIVTYSLSLIALALAIGLAIQHFLGVQNVLLVFLPVILLAAVKFGFWTASWVSVVSVLTTSFFFAEPRYSFAVADSGNAWALAVFLLASALTSGVAAQARQRAEAVSDHNRILEQLYAFASSLASQSSREVLIREIVRQAEGPLAADVVYLEQAGPGNRPELRVIAFAPDSVSIAPPDLADAYQCLETGRAVDSADDPSSRLHWCFRPIEVRGQRIAVLGVRARTSALRASQAEARLMDLLIEQVEANLARVDLAEEMQQAAMRVETEKLQTALLTSISHDLRTPLASILGNVTSVRSYGHLYDDATRVEMLEQAEVETRRLSRFVDNLLQMTRIESGALKPNLELIEFRDVIGSALKRMERALEGHLVRVTIEEPEPMLMLDFVLAEQVIANLLDNAAKYSPVGTTIEIDVRKLPGQVAVSIRDEGYGVSPEYATRIFERFFRVESADRRPAGTGLGLAVCKGFVEAMGGTIGFASRSPTPGSEFVVSFPIEREGASLQ